MAKRGVFLVLFLSRLWPDLLPFLFAFSWFGKAKKVAIPELHVPRIGAHFSRPTMMCWEIAPKMNAFGNFTKRARSRTRRTRQTSTKNLAPTVHCNRCTQVLFVCWFLFLEQVVQLAAHTDKVFFRSNPLDRAHFPKSCRRCLSFVIATYQLFHSTKI